MGIFAKKKRAVLSDPLKYQRMIGITLMELTVVLLILIGLAGVLVPYVSGVRDLSACASTEASLVAIRNAIVGSFEQPGYFEDMRALPASVNDLWVKPAGASDFNPLTRRGWRGPYLISPAAEDAYLKGMTLVIQVPTVDGDGNDCSDINAGYSRDDCARVISAGPDGVLDTQPVDANASSRGDDRVLFLFVPDPGQNNPASCL